MIILITGASLTGKTLLAQRMLEEYKMPYVSIDHLKMGLIRSGKTDLTPEDDEALTVYLWPIVREMNYYINGFAQYGEQVMLIDTDYEDTINTILENN